ncbi:MAG: winged helix-turn-helix domain-containing protein [Alphaproteobacteria bacterium]|nr:winged helix-turn-helix domain-containing protein [Alphaproteobacteria bacterium]
MISFGDFRFDPTQQVLYRQGKAVDLTDKQSRLLALLICAPDRIFSKEDILDAVWDGRAVSEQVVFQNISKLRTLIAQDAIKTFPKKGYQWQLPFDDQVAQAAPRSVSMPKRTSYGRWIIATVAGVALMAILLWLPRQQVENRLVAGGPIAFLPIDVRFDGSLTGEREQLNSLIADGLGVPMLSGAPVSAREFLNSAYMERQKLGLEGGDILMSGILRRSDGRHLLVLRLQGQYRAWEAYIQADDIDAVAGTVVAQVQQVLSSQYFSLADDMFVTSELALLHDQTPDNPAVLVHLIERHLQEVNADVAGGYIDKLLALSRVRDWPAYEATALWLAGRKAIALGEFEAAAGLLDTAAKVAADAELLFIQSEILKVQAEIAYRDDDFEAVRRLLVDAAALSRLANEPVKEVRAYTLLSIMASKLGHDRERYEYLHHAKALLADGKFDNSHYMLINYHFALFADEVAEQERWLVGTLSRPITPENAWVYESAADELVALLLKEERADEALAVANDVPMQDTAHMLRADIFLAQDKVAEGLAEAREAFTQARIAGRRWVGLPMALLLLDDSVERGDQTAAAEYRRYLRDNRIGHWRTWQEGKLKALGVE